jgi:hypothetical protein
MLAKRLQGAARPDHSEQSLGRNNSRMPTEAESTSWRKNLDSAFIRSDRCRNQAALLSGEILGFDHEHYGKLAGPYLLSRGFGQLG